MNLQEAVSWLVDAIAVNEYRAIRTSVYMSFQANLESTRRAIQRQLEASLQVPVTVYARFNGVEYDFIADCPSIEKTQRVQSASFPLKEHFDPYQLACPVAENLYKQYLGEEV